MDIMVYEPKHKLAVDTQKKKELAKQLPEPARDVILHMPEHIEFERFVDHIILAEKLYRRTRHKDEGAGPTASIISTTIIALSLIFILYHAFLNTAEIEAITMTTIAFATALLVLILNISMKRLHALAPDQVDYS